MWILIAGSDGTGKSVVADLLQRDKFEFHRTEVVKDEPGLSLELRMIARRLSVQLHAQKWMTSRDIVTIRSFWESVHVFAPIALEREEITKREYALITDLYENLEPHLLPPSAVIWTRSDRTMSAMDRALLKTGSADEERVRRIEKSYEEFISRIRVPVIEINASEVPERLKDDLEFGVASIRASKLSEHTIWAKRFYR